jgi:hypothetical protein
VADAPASGARLTGTVGDVLAIPDEGLDEVLRAWNGPGQLLAALAAVKEDDGYEREWSPIDVRRRAHRILFAEIEEFLRRWPTRSSEWLRALPAESYRLREVAPAPVGRVSWPETFRRFRWPPEHFVTKSRRRIPDELLTTAARWTIERLSEIRLDATAVAPKVDDAVFVQLNLAASLLDMSPLNEAVGVRPSSTDVRAIARQGWPWAPVADVADHIRRAESSVHEYARRLLMPSDELRSKLFHLAVLGQLLRALRARGATIVSLRPLARTTSGPAYRVGAGDTFWDLWFEAGAAWSHYLRSSPYLEAAAVVQGQARPLSPDLLLLRVDEAALIVECKYSATADYVGGRGISQVMAYAVEILTALAPHVVSRVVAPVQALKASGAGVATSVGTVAVVDAHQFQQILDEVGFPSNA